MTFSVLLLSLLAWPSALLASSLQGSYRIVGVKDADRSYVVKEPMVLKFYEDKVYGNIGCELYYADLKIVSNNIALYDVKTHRQSDCSIKLSPRLANVMFAALRESFHIFKYKLDIQLISFDNRYIIKLAH